MKNNLKKSRGTSPLKTKIAVLSLAFLLVVSLFGLSVSATSAEAPATVSEAAEELKYSEIVEGESLPDASDEEKYIPWSRWLLDLWQANKTEIFALAGVIMTAVLAFITKKGMLPELLGWLKNIVSALTSGFNSLKEASDLTDSKVEKLACGVEPLTERVIEALDMVSCSVEEIEGVKSKIEENEAQISKEIAIAAREREAVRSAMKLQAEMFNSFIQLSSLPQYRKDEYGAKFVQMNKEIGSFEEDGESK